MSPKASAVVGVCALVPGASGYPRAPATEPIGVAHCRVLLLKLPYCAHPAVAGDRDFRTVTSFRPVPSLGLASLCAFVRTYDTYGYEVSAVDLNIRAYTVPGEPVDVSRYPQLLEDAIRTSQYDVLGISAAFIFNVRWVADAVALSRRYHPKAKIIVGGGYPTLFPERCLSEQDVDAVVIGEGETTLLHLLHRFSGHRDVALDARFPIADALIRNEVGAPIVPGRKDRRSFLSLEDLPPPAWDALDVQAYFQGSGDRTLPIEGSRGCPYRCSYCSVEQAWGLRVRYKPVEALIAEMRAAAEVHGARGIHFVDDNLAFNKSWFRDFLSRLLIEELPLSFDASNFSVKHLDEEIIDLLARNGMTRISVAVETGCPAVQKQINKKLDLNWVRTVVQMIKHRGLSVHLCWMVGFPGESRAQIQQTVDLARELRAHSNQFLAVVPYPGTKLFDDAERAGLLALDQDDLDRFDYRAAELIKSDEWSYEELRDLIYDVNIEVNFLENGHLESPKGREYFLEYLEALLLRLPEHVIAHILAGHLQPDASRRDAHFGRASELLRTERLARTFRKYLDRDSDALRAFRAWSEVGDVGVQTLPL